jgi:hypothetical protein
MSQQLEKIESPVPSAPETRLTTIDGYVATQVASVGQHVQALRMFRADEFGGGVASPSPAQIAAVNQLLVLLRQPLDRAVNRLQRSAGGVRSQRSSETLEELLLHKERAELAVKAVERVWGYYMEVFGQRRTTFAPWLLANDRIGLDCYQTVYLGLGRARSIPSPTPMTCMATERTPSTFRRGVHLPRLGPQANPFPVVQLPYHRLVNPWSLGAVHHEVSHNLQHDLNMWETVPVRIGRRLLGAGLDRFTTKVWQRWHKEIWADLCGVLLGGPAIVESLVDLLSRPRESMGTFRPTEVHPPPYWRAFINFELLRRMGFTHQANDWSTLWSRLYGGPTKNSLSKGMPTNLRMTFSKATRLVVDEVCFQPYAELGNKRLVDVVPFRSMHTTLIREAAARVARGIDPGVIPARFLVGAAREALTRRLAAPAVISHNFYQALVAR